MEEEIELTVTKTKHERKFTKRDRFFVVEAKIKNSPFSNRFKGGYIETCFDENIFITETIKFINESLKIKVNYKDIEILEVVELDKDEYNKFRGEKLTEDFFEK